MNKKEINEKAEMHKLTKVDSGLLQISYKKFLEEIKDIIKRDDLPEGDWRLSADFEWLVRQKES